METLPRCTDSLDSPIPLHGCGGFDSRNWAETFNDLSRYGKANHWVSQISMLKLYKIDLRFNLRVRIFHLYGT